MMARSAVHQLPIGWCLIQTESRWVVGRVSDSCGECSESVDRLAEGRTVGEAIRKAHAVVDQREREAEERRADYERRKAAGQLTAWEKLAEQGMLMWEPLAARASQQSTVFASLVDRAYDDTANQGDTIQVNSHEYKAVR